MELVKLSNLFEAKYGVNLELCSLEENCKINNGYIPFVSRTENNNGVSAFVKIDPNLKAIQKNTLTVAVSGSVLSTFLQPYEYYSGRDLYYLIPKRKMTERELIYYAICIKKNKYKYSYGRQANKTLKNLLIPAEVPKNFLNLDIKNLNEKSFSNKNISLKDKKWNWFKYDDLFEIQIGKSIDLNKLEQVLENGINYVGRTEENNGITSKVKDSGEFEIYNGGCITVPMVGNELKSSFQEERFCVSQNIAILRTKNNFKMNKFVALFLGTIFRKDRFRFAYGRTLSLDRLKSLKIKLPIDKNGNPDWQFMEDYIKSLPYSASI